MGWRICLNPDTCKVKPRVCSAMPCWTLCLCAGGKAGLSLKSMSKHWGPLRGKSFEKMYGPTGEKKEDRELNELSTVVSYTTYIMHVKHWRLSNWWGWVGYDTWPEQTRHFPLETNFFKAQKHKEGLKTQPKVAGQCREWSQNPWCTRMEERVTGQQSVEEAKTHRGL
jgi:hypothetical protein